MLDLHLVVLIFSNLRDQIAHEPKLSGFAPAATELLIQAESLVRGERDLAQIESLGRVPTGPDLPVIPNENLATTLRTTFDRLPSHGDDEAELLARAYRRLLRNAAVSVLFAVFEQYPQVIPKDPARP
jgi:hypothetical protein